MQLVDLFSSFIVVDQVNIDMEKLKDFCQDIYDNDKGRKVSNRGGYQSNNLNLSDHRLTELLYNIEYRLNIISEKIGMVYNLNHTVDSMWLNVNNKGDFNVPHFHDTSFFSGVFYLTESSGKFVIKETNGLRSSKLNLDIIQDKNSKYLVDEWIVEPAPNKLIIFPCWLLHYVTPECDDQRISLAFNARTYEK